MDSRHPSRIVLIAPGVVGIIALIALAAVPQVMTRRIEALRTSIEQKAEPARQHLNEVNYHLSRQIASLSRDALTADDDHLDEYRAALAAQERAMQPLAADARAMGRLYKQRFDELNVEVQQWHVGVDRYLQARRVHSPAVAAAQGAYNANYPQVVEAISRLDEAITGFQNDGRAQVGRLTALELNISNFLVLLALVAAAMVFWMVLRLRALAIDLERQSNQRMALVRSRDEILGVVSHDLRTPLTTIALGTQLMEGATAEEQSEHRRTILSTIKRMERLIQDLLDVTKIEHGTLSVRKDIVDPAAIARETVAAHSPIAAEKSIRFVPRIAERLPQVNGDRDRLVQALSNLIGNALKFTPQGGTVAFIADHKDGRVVFEVTDSGPGISESDIPHLFEPFFQAKKTAHLGAGLGLKITRAITEAHGGTIKVANQPPGGACFTIEIPVSAGES